MNRKTAILILVLSLFVSIESRAGYDPTIGRWLSRDPMNNAELRQGPNLYSYVGNNPINAIDPLGLFTAVIIGGATADNPFGHVGIGVTGSGIYSFGTGTAPGSSFTGYLQAQAAYRSSDVYFINTSPEQEAAILQYLQSLDPNYLPKVPSSDSHDTCATRVNDALGKAGLLDPSLGFMPFFNFGSTSPFPGSTAVMATLHSNGFVVHIPQGSSYIYGAPFTYINPGP